MTNNPWSAETCPGNPDAGDPTVVGVAFTMVTLAFGVGESIAADTDSTVALGTGSIDAVRGSAVEVVAGSAGPPVASAAGASVDVGLAVAFGSELVETATGGAPGVVTTFVGLPDAASDAEPAPDEASEGVAGLDGAGDAGEVKGSRVGRRRRARLGVAVARIATGEGVLA